MDIEIGGAELESWEYARHNENLINHRRITATFYDRFGTTAIDERLFVAEILYAESRRIFVWLSNGVLWQGYETWESMSNDWLFRRVLTEKTLSL